MVKIIMTATKLGSNDGATVREYAEGQEYDVSPALAREFVKMDAAIAEGLDEHPDDAESGQQVAAGTQGDGSPPSPAATKRTSRRRP